MEVVSCLFCPEETPLKRFEKPARSGDVFSLMKCPMCGLEFVSPRPTIDEIHVYYQGDYFTQRDDRGYNNYFSHEVRKEIERVLYMNLRDLGFFNYEKNLDSDKSALDIGCASGYSVAFFQNRGWDSKGIDIAHECIEAGKREGLDLIEGSYLNTEFNRQFDVITLWATIEHLHQPEVFIKKIKQDLKPGGMLYISTCRQGGANFMRLHGCKWRFYNFPEHLYFFSYKNLNNLLNNFGFNLKKYITYGSGTGHPNTLLRRISDVMAKKFRLGDMMIVAAEKENL